MRRRPFLLLPALPAVALLGCGGPPPPPPPPPPVLDLTLKGGVDQNPDLAGNPTSVAVRLYFLAGPGKFERADVFALIEREAATLSDELMGSEEIIVSPGQTLPVKRDLKPGVKFLGVAVLFRDINRATWRSTAPLAANGPTSLTLAISGLKTSLASA